MVDTDQREAARPLDLPVQIDTADLPPHERAEALREAIWQLVVRVEIEHQPPPAPITARCDLRDLGPLRVCSVRSNTRTIRRTRALSGDDLEPSVFLGLQVSGTSMVIQHGREAVLGAGDLVLYDTTSPYTLVNPEGIDHHYFRIPRSALALPDRAIDGATAVTLGRDHPLGPIAAGYFAGLAATVGLTREVGDAMAIPSIELVRALITTRIGSTRLAHEPLANSLVVRVLAYVRANLADASLTPARIAAHHNVSVRSLYAAMAVAGISLADWIREHRLEACRIELSRPGLRNYTVAAIAHRWGFVDPTHFSRAFRAAYGVSPREWREHATGVDDRQTAGTGAVGAVSATAPMPRSAWGDTPAPVSAPVG